MKKLIKVTAKSSLPKYRQIIDSVYMAINNGKLKKGDKIPSINKISTEYNISRDTVISALAELKSRGIIISQPGKGNYIAHTEIGVKEKVFVLFDELNSHKQEIYGGLMSVLKGEANIELFFHHYSFKKFRSHIVNNAGRYSSYIIMPSSFENLNHLISKLSDGKVLIIDILKSDLDKYSTVYQDYELDLYEALHESTPLLKKYRKLVMVNSGEKGPGERVTGFERYCQENNYDYKIIKSIDESRPGLYEAWFVISDNDLIKLLKLTREYNYKLGKKFGVVSLNESKLKQVVEGGITTISADFREMGMNAGKILLSQNNKKVRNNFRLIVRNSL